MIEARGALELVAEGGVLARADVLEQRCAGGGGLGGFGDVEAGEEDRGLEVVEAAVHAPRDDAAVGVATVIRQKPDLLGD